MRLLASTAPICFLLGLILLCGCGGSASSPTGEVTLLTTTEVRDSGVLEKLLPAFEKRTGGKVKVIAVSSAEAVQRASQGEGDVLLSHSPEAEKEQLVQPGLASGRSLVMVDEFLLVGPVSDPLRLKGQKLGTALRTLAEKSGPFLSCGDQSVFHAKEQQLWLEAGIQPRRQPWYRVAGQTMGPTLEMAAQQKRYCITDRLTFLKLRSRLELQAITEPDPQLAALRLHHIILFHEDKGARRNAKGGLAFADFMLSKEGQALIAEHGRAEFGQHLFYAAAGHDEAKLMPQPQP
jgi:tungstate transport system substrate-binding protein